MYEEIQKIVNDAKSFGVKVIPPKLSSQNVDFSIVGDKEIAFGLASLRDVGEKQVAVLLKHDNDACFESLVLNSLIAGRRINKKVMTAMILSGALDETGLSRRQMLAQYELLSLTTPNERLAIGKLLDIKDVGAIECMRALSDEGRSAVIKDKFDIKIPNKSRREKIRGILSEYDSKDVVDGFIERLNWEKDYLGIALSGSETQLFPSKHHCRDILSGDVDNFIEMSVKIDSVRRILTKESRREMAFLTVHDHTGQLDSVVVFPQQFERSKALLGDGNLIKLKGKIDDGGSVIANRLERLK
jgi:DNA polymerase-3 subunit alpha